MNDPTLEVDRDRLRRKELVETAMRTGAGAVDVVLISSSDISVEDGLANLCGEPRCLYYGLSANCPPYVSGSAGFRDLLRICKYALVIKMEIPVDVGSLVNDDNHYITRLMHEIVADIERLAVEKGFSDSKAFAAGSCKVIFCHENGNCRVSTGGECRYPQNARPSMSSSGVNVNALIKTTGWFVNQDTIKPNSDKVSMGAIYGLVLIG